MDGVGIAARCIRRAQREQIRMEAAALLKQAAALLDGETDERAIRARVDARELARLLERVVRESQSQEERDV